MKDGLIEKMPLSAYVAAISVGVVNGQVLLDLCYEEDSHATVDMNVIMTEYGEYIEVQGTGEQAPFTRAQLDDLLNSAGKGIKELIELQKAVVDA